MAKNNKLAKNAWEPKNTELAKKVWRNLLENEAKKLGIIKEDIKTQVRACVLEIFKSEPDYENSVEDRIYTISIKRYKLERFQKAIRELGFKEKYIENLDIAIEFPEKGGNTEAGKLALELEKEIETYYKEQNMLAKEATDKFFELLLDPNNYSYTPHYDVVYNFKTADIFVVMPVAYKNNSPQFMKEVNRILRENEFFECEISETGSSSKNCNWKVTI